MNDYPSTIDKTCYFERRRVTSICRFLTNTTTNTVISDSEMSRFVNCDSLLICPTDDLSSHLSSSHLSHYPIYHHPIYHPIYHLQICQL